MKLRALAAIAALALALGPATAAAAAPAVHEDTGDFGFDSFDAQYYLDLDAAGRSITRVVETLVAEFPDFDQNRGIIRAIPLTDQDYPLGVTMNSVTDGNASPVHYERNDYDGFAEFALGTDDYVHGRTTYVLDYTLHDTIRHFADSGGDEFYWDVNGTGWAQAFGTVSTTVHIGERLAARLTGDASCYAGYYGDSTTCPIARDGDTFTASVGPVYGYNTLTIAIGFDGGAVVQPQLPRDSPIVQVAPKVLFALEGLLVIAALVIRFGFWRDARGRGIVVAQFEPPKGSHLLLDAELVKRRSSGLSAEFVDLSVRGMIKIIDNRPGEPVGASDHQRFSLELVTSDGAEAHELRVLQLLFGKSLEAGKRVKPGSLSAAAGASLYGLSALAAAQAVTDGLRAEVTSGAPKVIGRIGGWILLAFAAIGIWAVLNDVLEGNVVWPGIGAIVLAIAARAVLARPKLLTTAGAASRDYLLGLREYLTIAEQDRLRVLQSPAGADRVDVTDTDAVVRLNERLLPYAVLWGVEDRWVEQLRAEYPQGTPTWLEGGSLDAALLRSFTTSSTYSVRPIVASSSSGGGSWSSGGGSSFSSGSFGGGFSGGGGGGGGGGGR